MAAVPALVALVIARNPAHDLALAIADTATHGDVGIGAAVQSS